MQWPTYKTLVVSEAIPNVMLVLLNRPRQRNTMTNDLFTELNDCFGVTLKSHDNIRAIVLASASDTIFSAGLDLKSISTLVGSTTTNHDPARKGIQLMKLIRDWQRHLSSIDTCPVPVIAAIHGACIGGGVDLITATDIRICSKLSSFSIKEVDVAMAADIGTLQRLPKIIGNQSLVREWAYTGRQISAEEALATGLVSHVAENREKTIQYALDLAKVIAKKSPLAIYGIKTALNYSRDHSVHDGLLQIAMWNSSQLQSEDVMTAAASILAKTTPSFPKL